PTAKTIYERFPYLKLIVDRAEGRTPTPEGMQIPRFPKHVAVIMDGNRRWIRNKEGANAKPIEGHIQGMNNMIEILRSLRELPIDYVTLWAFSPENWGRDRKEIDALMGLFATAIPQVLPEIQANNGRVIHLGRTDRIPAEVRRVLGEMEAATEKNTGQTVCLAIDYGSEDQETRVLQKALRMAAAGELPPGIEADEAEVESLRKSLLDTRLDDGTDIPPIDLIFRTGGEQRDSGIPNAAYAEFYFIQAYLPNAKIDDFVTGIANYAFRERRFGGNAARKL
ncbi:MAG: polyprenyl diphosphate synthase, partial [Candidatus Levyibacteriota bacterium]